MLSLIIRIILTTIVVVSISHLLPGLEVKNTLDAIFFGLILGFINAVVRPILTFLTLPITIFTLGLFLMIINTFTFWLASEISYGVHISSFWGALWGGVIVWISGLITNRLIWSRKVY